ncbi:hypothetical protein [Anaerocolumna aminovalerica]|uniref:hypothetical protein n=1 Tax=Anaerocolumna aminovalerica TaxID=1527 RepID=UPI0020A0D37E|nr:hypothetical protein [Anaerocolumna aminovalerica]
MMPDMREKIKEYIQELKEESDRCLALLEQDMTMEMTNNGCYNALLSRMQTLEEVISDLENRLEEVI